MPYALAMRRIIFPQMWGYLIPAYTNHATGLIKECSVLSIITVPEIAMAAQFVIGETFAPLQGYAMVSVLYWALTSAVQRFHRASRDAAAAPPQRHTIVRAHLERPHDLYRDGGVECSG